MQTTTNINGCDAVILLADENDILQDISGSSNEFSMDFSENIGSTKVFGNDFPIRSSCGKDCAISLSVVYSTALNEGSDVLHEWYFGTGGKRRFQIKLPNGDVGGFTYYGYVRLQKMTIPVKADDATPIKIAASLMPDGDIQRIVTAS